MALLLGYFLFSLPVLLLYVFLMTEKRKSQQGSKLPPGSMGWPYVGETLQLYSQDPNLFFASKQKRYGELFKSNILGCPCVMLASPEAARFVLVTQAHLFKPTYPKSKEQLIGPSALFYQQGDYHTRLRKLVQGAFTPESIRNLVPDIEAIAMSLLDSWAGGHIVNIYNEMKKLSFHVAILAIFGHLDDYYKKELNKNYCIIDKGYNSFPTKIPGTPYRNAVLARKRLSQILSEIICQRKERKVVEKDLLGSLMNSQDEKGKILTDDQIADNIIGVVFAAQDTTASVLTWLLKYLHDNPKLLESIKAEQNAIFESNNEGNRQLTWAQSRNMPLTQRVRASFR